MYFNYCFQETSRRFLQLSVPHFTCLGGVSLYECPSKPNSLFQFHGILNSILKNKPDFPSPNALIKKYYDYVANELIPTTDELLLDVYREITSENILPVESLSQWVALRYDDATQYYTLRKQIAIHMSLLSLCEYIFHLSPATLDGLCLNLGTGQTMNVDCLFGLRPETCKFIIQFYPEQKTCSVIFKKFLSKKKSVQAERADARARRI
ncbi:unnamed protein product [Gongylonema pulchrum]|uniref:Uncharacterized protein n=1 Tax=Gongylonema pulchrum TaxID=637853 RepID=A0A3P6R0W3_9BILA|nr:unnamed protein product [Gongylonema pulchrum]